MKLFISLSIICMSFGAAASNDAVSATSNDISCEMYIGNDRGKKSRKNKRINKKRKRKCAKFGRRGFAG
jgi:hypothetical protein